MIKSILVAMDGSPASMAGLEVAVYWAKLLKAGLRGLFVEDEQRFVHYPSGMAVDGGLPIFAPLLEAEMRAETEQVELEGREIHRALQKAAGEAGLSHDFTQLRGEVNGLITRHALAAGMVVLGRRGRNDPLEGNEPGPTTETLIHTANRPVLVVPESPRMEGGVMFAYDGGRGINRALVAGTQLAIAGDLPVSAISIGKEPSFMSDHEEILRCYWEAFEIEATCHVLPKDGRVASMIVDFADREGAGLIVMGAFGHNPIHELFFGSTTLETMSRASCPVLLMT